jgi:ssDNA-specific exonuclease RecJ
MEDPKSTSERVQGKEKLAANSLKNLVYSIPMSVEDKVVLEDMINKLSQEADTMLYIINDIPKRHQKQVLLGYKTMLQSVIAAVNHRLKSL